MTPDQAAELLRMFTDIYHSLFIIGILLVIVISVYIAKALVGVRE